MKKVIIIGGGFAGLAALKRLSWYKVGAEITLIEKKKTHDFLPELPDTLGRLVKPEHLARDIKSIVHGYGAALLQGEATSIDLERMEVHCAGERHPYDYLIIATGSETNFYGDGKIKKSAYKLDDVEDAQKLREIIRSGSFQDIIVAGGGYTGIEVATNLRKYCKRRKIDRKIYIVERSRAILGPLPQELKEYTALNLVRMGIRAVLDTTITNVDNDSLTLSNGEVFEKALLIWAAGVKTTDLIDRLNVEKMGQGRIKVDEYLKVEERVFAAGDTANFIHEGRPLRMAVQFAICEGIIAAENVANSIRGKPLLQYKPVDLGYIVPMANNRSCGIVFGKYVKGFLATALHYIMCVYRLRGFGNKIGLLLDLIR